jgi:serine/threonine protein kinase
MIDAKAVALAAARGSSVAYLELKPGDPRRLGPYRLIGRLNASGMGQVFLAQSSAGRAVALKVIPAAHAADPRLQARFTDGVSAARRVEGTFTAAVVDADLDAPRPWVATIYVPGPTLLSLVAQQGPLPGVLVLALGIALAEGLREIHAAGVVHRDLQPSNVILGSDGPRIIDFGNAAMVESAGTPDETMIVGTPGFMSPEQERGGAVGPASDIFSLGAVLTFAATGRSPFQPGRIAASLYQIINAETELATVPAVIWPLLTRCIAKDPSTRLSAIELVAATYDLAVRKFGLDDIALQGVMQAIPGWGGPKAAAGPLTGYTRMVTYADMPSVSFPQRPMTSRSAWHPKPPEGAGLVLPDDQDFLDDLNEPDPAPRSAGTAGTVQPVTSGPPDEYWRAADPAGASALREENLHSRFLTGVLPERAPTGVRLSLLVMITRQRGVSPSAGMKDFAISPTGVVLTITVSAPGLAPSGDLEQELFVPFAVDSEPVRFGFMTGPAGLHAVVVRAFSGGTFLGELTLQISVEPGAALEDGRGRTATLTGLAAEPGEVTLQVSRTDEDRYSFQLIGETWNPVEVTRRLAGDPTQVVGALIDELRAMSANESRFSSPALIRNRIRNLGAQLWADVVPEAIRRQFWAQGDRIRLFTIASDMDTVPWELLYPVDGDNDNGFLVEQFPVVRRVYGQGRTRVLRLDNGAAYVVPPGSPTNAMDEVDGVRGIFPANVRNRGVHASLAEFIELLETVPSVLHFACHNTFTETSGSFISLEGGPLRPSDLAIAVQQKGLATISPLVFLNACRTAGDIPGLMQLMGWARHFMGAGAGAFIGSLWAVRSTSAKTFAEVFYRAMLKDGLPLGAASLRARQAISGDPGDPTWLAYTVYGNPSASIDHDQP